MEEQFVTGPAITHWLDVYAKLAAACPEEVALIRDVTLEHLKTMPKPANNEIWGHLGGHLNDVIPAVFNDPRLDGLGAKFEAEGAKIMAAEPHHFVSVVIGWAAGAIAVAAVAVAAYCTTGPWPAKGESADAHCT
jgi:hypothetical protein